MVDGVCGASFKLRINSNRKLFTILYTDMNKILLINYLN